MSDTINKNITINDQSLTISNKIGKGSYATVYKAFMSSNEEPVAIKIIKNSNIISNNLKANNNILNNIEVEINILKRLKNPNIVKLISYSIPKTLQSNDEEVSNNKNIIIVMEFCDIGDLSNIIRFSNTNSMDHKKQISSNFNYHMLEKITNRFPMNTYNGLNCVLTYSFIKQIANALHFIQSKNLIHRDIKPQNLLLTSQADNLVPVLKIADFGFARFLPQQSMAETLCGSPQWMAPEILSYKKYDAKIDLWSVGCVIYEMCFGKPAFQAKNYIDLLNKIKTVGLKFPAAGSSKSDTSLSSNSSSSSDDDFDDSDEIDEYDILDSNMEELIKRLLTYNPVKRMSFDEFFNHHLVKSFDSIEDTFNVEKLLALKESNSARAELKDHNFKPITYNEVFDSSSDEEYEDSANKNITTSQQYSEADGYLMIPNEAIITTNEFPINGPRRKSKVLVKRTSSNKNDHSGIAAKHALKSNIESPAQLLRRESSISNTSADIYEEKKRRSSSFAGMTKAITKAFRSASIISNASSQSSSRVSPDDHQQEKLSTKNIRTDLVLRYDQYLDLTAELPNRLKAKTNKTENISSTQTLSTQNSDISKVRQLSKTHVFMKYLKQEESGLSGLSNDDFELLIQLKIWFLGYLKKQMDSYKSKDYETLKYFKDKFDKVLDSVEVQYEEFVNIQSDNGKNDLPDKDTWSNRQIQDSLWMLSKKFARLGYRLETKKVFDKAALAYATSLWFMDFIITDFDFLDTSDNKFERMCVLTGDRLSSVYKY
ncbi:hypothetical protein ACO0OE_002144 [Hanseniaspora uvarum]